MQVDVARLSEILKEELKNNSFMKIATREPDTFSEIL